MGRIRACWAAAELILDTNTLDKQHLSAIDTLLPLLLLRCAGKRNSHRWINIYYGHVKLNPSNAEATFVQSTRTQRYLNSLDGTLDGFQKSLRPCALYESSICIGRVKAGKERQERVTGLAVFPRASPLTAATLHWALSIFTLLAKYQTGKEAPQRLYYSSLTNPSCNICWNEYKVSELFRGKFNPSLFYSNL